MLPQAYAYPAERRATSDLRRRRMPFMWKRAELLTHVQNTNRQYNLPEIGKKIAYKANRPGVAQQLTASAVQKRIEVDRALIDHDERMLNDLALSMLNPAKQHEAHTLSLLPTILGMGQS